MCIRDRIQGVLGIFYSHVKRTDIPLYCSVHPSVPDELSGDPSRLRQVLINLVGNAFKFTADGYILLTVSVNPLASGQVKFSIRDSGCGISAAAQNKLFSAFTQVDASTSRKYGGTGLGLAISKNLTVLMGGEIGVESNEGIGSCFYFTANMVQDRCNGEADDNADSHFLENNEVENNQIQRPTGFLGFSPPAAAIIVWSRVELGDILAIYFIQFNVRVLRCGSRQQLNVMLEEHRQCLLGVFIDEQFETANKLVLAGICTPSVAATNSNHQLEGLARQADKDKNPIARQPLPLKWIFLTGDIEDRTISSIAHGFEMCRWGIINRFYDELLLDSSEADCQHHHAFETIRQGLKVLVAEDVATNQEVIRGFMEELGHEVRIVEDGIQAVQDYKQHNEDYDLILMDCAMPEMDGYEATRSIRRFEKSQIKKPALIVALTAHAFAEHREECIAAGMNDHLSKPITLKSLVNVLNRHFPEPNPNPGS
ncbi:MAG: response regulator [Pseudomonadales bacterium]|nr:response regulator [Pseudomonadales bacterium]